MNLTTLLLAALATAPLSFAQQVTRIVAGEQCKVRTDLPDEIAKPLAARIDEYWTSCSAFYESLGLVARNKNEVVLRVFANFDDFADYRDRHGVRDYLRMFWSDSLNTIVAYYDPADPSIDARLFGLCSDMYLRRYVEAPPEWLRRGFEGYFRGHEVEPGKPVSKTLPLVEVVALQAALKKGEYVKLEELTKRPRARFSERPDGMKGMANLLPDAEAWGLVHYLLELAPPVEQETFRRFVKGVNAKGSKSDSARMEVLNWTKLEEGWKAAMLAIDPKCDTAQQHLRVADGYMEVLNFNHAIPEYEAAFKLDRRLRGLAYKGGYALKRAGDYKTAIWWFERAIEADPKSPLPHHQLSRMYTALESLVGAQPEPAKAVEHAQKAVELAGVESPLYLSWLAKRRPSPATRRRR